MSAASCRPAHFSYLHVKQPLCERAVVSGQQRRLAQHHPHQGVVAAAQQLLQVHQAAGHLCDLHQDPFIR